MSGLRAQVLAHLRACADVWGNYIRTIIAEDRPQFRAVSPRTWIKQTDYPDLAFRPSLGASFDGGKGPRIDRVLLCGAATCP